MSRENTSYKISKEIVTFAPFPTFVLNTQGIVTVSNDLCTKYFGYSNNEFAKDYLNNSLLSSLPEESWNRILLGKNNFVLNKFNW